MCIGEMLWLLIENIGDSFNSMARMHRGWEGKWQGEITQWPIGRVVLDAVIEFAEASQRVFSRSLARPVNSGQRKSCKT